MTKRAYIAYRLLLTLLLFSIFLSTLYATGSVIYSVLLTALCIVLYVFVRIFISNYKGRHLKKFLLSVGQNTSPREVDFDDGAPPLQDFIKFNGRSFSVGIKVGRRGIYILCTGLFSVTIPWDQVINVSLFKLGSKLKAKLMFSNTLQAHSELVMGWDESFEEFIPKSTAYKKG